MPRPIRVRPANSLWQRLRRRWRAWRGAGMLKTHRVHILTIGRQRYKQVSFADTPRAEACAAALRALEPSGCFPALVRHHEHQVWTEFVNGHSPGHSPGDAPDERAALVDFFVTLYARPAEGGAPDLPAHRRELEFLHSAGYLEPARLKAVAERAERLAPANLALGHDYLDPVRKNFILTGAGAVGIDIEALLAGQPLGLGLAKARLRWLGDDHARVLEALRARGHGDVADQFEFVEQLFVVRYFVDKLIQRKPGHIDAGVLERLVH